MYYPSQTHAILFDAKNCKVNKSNLVAEDWGDAGEGYYVESEFIKTGKKFSLRFLNDIRLLQVGILTLIIMWRNLKKFVHYFP